MAIKMKPVQPPDSFRLSAAICWLDLGNWQEANEKLEKVARAMRAHPEVLELRGQIYAKAG